MRKFLIPLLLASALAPAAAFAEDGGLARGLRAQAERSNRDNSDNRPQRVERTQRSERSDRPARVERPQRVERADRPARIERDYGSSGDRRVERRVERPAVEPVREVRPVESVRRADRRSRTNDNLADGFRSAVRDQRDLPGYDRDRVVRRDYDPSDDRDGWRDRDGRRWRWSGDWRHDRRYDWYNYRHRYGSLFRLGRYHDPYGWGYRRFSIGFNLWPSYYGSNYWLDDPWQYRLPPAYGPYRWVRYYDDALLVNIYTGQVVDVIHNFFW